MAAVLSSFPSNISIWDENVSLIAGGMFRQQKPFAIEVCHSRMGVTRFSLRRMERWVRNLPKLMANRDKPFSAAVAWRSLSKKRMENERDFH
jgi:hypothetical protein